MLVTLSLSAAGADVQPLLECVWSDQTQRKPTYEAVWGYDNTSSSTVTLPLGSSNGFSPDPADRGQGTSFLPGRNDNTVVTTWDGSGNVQWNLGSGTATAKKNSTPCAAPPISMPADVGIAPMALLPFLLLGSALAALAWLSRRRGYRSVLTDLADDAGSRPQHINGSRSLTAPSARHEPDRQVANR